MNDDGLFKAFLRHLFPRIILRKNLKVTYTFCLGGLSFTAFLLLLSSGVLLLFYYQPANDRAFQSILYLESSVSGGWYVRNLHRLAANTFLALLGLHTIRVILTGAYRRPRELNWIIGFTIFCLAIFEAYIGYLLPMDQRALWATQAGMKLVEMIPFGGVLRAFLVPDNIGQPLSILRFYVLHICIIPFLILSLSCLHFYRIRKDKGVLPYL